jgi:nitrogen fixation/metabolism regulation signal transduction histidine kinase
MVFKKFQIQVMVRILLILANCIWISIEIPLPPNLYTLIFLASLLIIQVYLLIRYVNKSNRELSRIFSALWDQDSSFSLAPSDPSGSFSEIARVINESRQQIQEARIDKEKQYRYLQFIINHMDIGLLSFHGDGRVEHYNRAAGLLLGSRELSALKSLNVLHPDFEKTLQEMEAGQSKIVTISPGGESMQLLIRMTQLVYEDQPLKLLSLQDVRTELDEQELIAWKRLIRVLNHEVMNSLTPIRTLTHAIDRSLEELKPGDSDENIINDIRENSRLIAKRSTSLSDFVNRYREITKIQEISLNKIPVASLFKEVQALFSKELSEQKSACSMEIDPPGLQLTGDENMLKQVVINLVRNSMDALKESSNGVIRLLARKEGKHVILAVEDNGPGIPAEYMNDIFTPFFSTREDGSGIGLSFSKHIIRLHGGHISIQSKPGRGTSLTMKFKDSE